MQASRQKKPARPREASFLDFLLQISGDFSYDRFHNENRDFIRFKSVCFVWALLTKFAINYKVFKNMVNHLTLHYRSIDHLKFLALVLAEECSSDFSVFRLFSHPSSATAAPHCSYFFLHIFLFVPSYVSPLRST
jgi:hypothetical protein